MSYQAIAEMMQTIYGNQLTTLSGGNLSMHDGDHLWITPSGIDKGNLSEQDIVCINADGSYIGKHHPSSEYPFHQAIYTARPDAKVILHAHSPALVAYCIAHKVPDTRIIKEAYAICGEIGYAEYVMPGSPQLGEKLASVFSEGYHIVLMENHGVVVIGDTLYQAYQRLEMASLVAQVTLYASSLKAVIATQHLLYDYPGAEPKSEDNAFADYKKRGVERGLFPLSTSQFHKTAENRYQITAQAPHLMAFAVTHSLLDTRTIPEAYLTLHTVPVVDDDEEIIQASLAQHEAIIVKNSRVIVRGSTALQAYDRLEVLEYTARSAIEAARIGGIVPMSEQAIHDLDQSHHQYYKGLSG